MSSLNIWTNMFDAQINYISSCDLLLIIYIIYIHLIFPHITYYRQLTIMFPIIPRYSPLLPISWWQSLLQLGVQCDSCIAARPDGASSMLLRSPWLEDRSPVGENMYVYIYIYTHQYTYLDIFIYIYTYIYTYTYTYFICITLSVYIYIYTYIYIRIHMYNIKCIIYNLCRMNQEIDT